MAIPGKAKLGPLTSFRFFAAICVVMCHFLTGADSGFRQNSRFHLVATYGSLGVSFFFILSGYILTYNYAGTRERAQSIDARNFWWRRFARVYPLYLFALLIDIPITAAYSVAAHGAHGAAIRLVPTFLTNAMLLQAWCLFFFGGWNPPGWTLSAESFFYLAFPSLSRKLAWTDCGGWKPTTAKCAGLLALGAIGLGVVDWEVARLSANAGQSLGLIYFLNYNPVIYTTLFFMGMILCVAEQRVRRQGSTACYWLNVVCGTIAVTGLADIALNFEIARGPRTSGACVFFVALIVLGGGGGPVWFSKLLSWSPLVLLGEASYAVYLLQFPLFDYCKKLWTVAGMGTIDSSAPSNLPFYLFYLMVLTGVSVLVFKMLEQPARRLLQKRQPWSWMPVDAKESTPALVSAGAGQQD